MSISTRAGIGNMRRLIAILMLSLLGGIAVGQETLLPLCREVLESKDNTPLTLPFFDDFSKPDRSATLWHLGGTFINEGYAPLPPTIGMATLDAYDNEGYLYPDATGQLFRGDTLLSRPIRLDSIFQPYKRPLTVGDSLYLSFFYLPGGGYGNMWERIGDTPEPQDSLILEFYNPVDSIWERVWSTKGCQADTLHDRTGSYWQFHDIPILDPDYLKPNFQFRFYNLCSLENNNKDGMLSNADQWNIDYVCLDAGRHSKDTASRDVAFVNPAPSLLKHYTAMPARQFTPNDLRDSLPLTITNRFTEELATNYSYTVFDDQGRELHHYNGGFENAPVYWRGHSYQTATAHAKPAFGYTLPVAYDHMPTTYTVVHGIREGVSGDSHPQNDTIVRKQVFGNYYAYDDGIPENGYGITSTTPHIKIACRFVLNAPDTITALNLYFNQTFQSQNARIRFFITIWDDDNGHPGNIIYQDNDSRRPIFEGLNRYVRYLLDGPVTCSGTIYVGLEQNSTDYINLGFDRNNDASSNILYLTGTSWQTSILRGALMLRPGFGHSATLDVNEPEQSQCRIAVQQNRIVITPAQPSTVTVADPMGRTLYTCKATGTCTTQPLQPGIYLIRCGTEPARKIIIP